MKHGFFSKLFIVLGVFVYSESTFGARIDVRNIEVYQQDKSVSGFVSDEKGESLIGVSVRVDGTTQGVVTDLDGNFVLTGLPGHAKLIFSYVGYVDQIIDVADKSKIKVIMKESSQQLEEVVVVGYGTQKKANLSGSVSTVGSDVLEGRPLVSAGQGLQGVIPNLNISIKNGDPNSSPEYNVRGNTSINGGGPLILVDGIPMSMDDLNPNDIKSVTVLKDAGSAAIYGARAAFGVILVETKKATEGKVRVKFNAELSLQQPIFHMDPVTDPYEFVMFRNKEAERDLREPFYRDEYVAAVKAYRDDPINNPEWAVVNGTYEFYGFNDYRNKIMTDYSPQQKYDMSLSGAGTKNKYYVSFSYLDTKGFFKNKEKNEDYKRFNVIMKNDLEVTKWLSLESKIIFNAKRVDKLHPVGDGDLSTFSRVEPVRPIEVPRIPGMEQLEGMYFEGLNMLPIIENGGRDITKNNSIWLTQSLELQPLKKWKICADFSYKVSSERADIDNKRVLMVQKAGLDGGDYFTYGKTASDYVSVETNYNQYYVINAYTEYLMEIKKHNIKAMIGYNQEWSQNQAATATGYSHASSSISDLDATVGLQKVNGGQNHLALMGGFYRLNYSFDDRYLLEFNGRYDGTSRFPSDSRFGFFPSFSAAWRISNEKFMEPMREYIDNLKIRASYGVLGNQSVSSYYPYISSMSVSTSPFQFDGSGYIPTVAAPGLVSPSLTWESVATTNFGFDLTMLNQRLDFSFDIYKRKTKDMLMSVTYPDLLGATAPKENGADLETNGWELSVKWRDKIGKNFRYDVTLSLSDYQAEITKYNNPTGAINDYYVGKKLGEIWGFKTHGIFQDEEEINSAPSQKELGNRWIPGDIRYSNLDGDNQISRGNSTLENHGDLTVIGNSTPRYSTGLNLNMHYKDFSLSMFFQGVLKRDYMPDVEGTNTWFYPHVRENVEKYWLEECWSEDNRDAYFPGRVGANFEDQTRYLQNAAYVRLKSLVLSYNIPKSMVEKWGIGGLQVSVSGSNLLTFSNIHKPLDPESIYSHIVTYPLMKVYSLNLSLTF